MKPFVIIDNGHGKETPGKGSPDGKLKEWQWTRKAAIELQKILCARGIGSILLVPCEGDLSLRERCIRANFHAAEHQDAILVSLHSNAAGDGTAWHSACGWSAYIAPKASEKSEKLARLLYGEAAVMHLLGNRATPPEGFYRANFAICRDTRCPAVLTENLFHDNREDAQFLMSEQGILSIALLHAAAIEKYYASMS